MKCLSLLNFPDEKITVYNTIRIVDHDMSKPQLKEFGELVETMGGINSTKVGSFFLTVTVWNSAQKLPTFEPFSKVSLAKLKSAALYNERACQASASGIKDIKLLDS